MLTIAFPGLLTAPGASPIKGGAFCCGLGLLWAPCTHHLMLYCLHFCSPAETRSLKTFDDSPKVTQLVRGSQGSKPGGLASDTVLLATASVAPGPPQGKEPRSPRPQSPVQFLGFPFACLGISSMAPERPGG